MIPAEKLFESIVDDIDRLACEEVVLLRVKGGTAEFKRGNQRLCCQAKVALRVLFLLPYHAGDDATWWALALEQLGCEEADDKPKSS